MQALCRACPSFVRMKRHDAQDLRDFWHSLRQGRVAMDSQKRDESRDRRREEALARRVGDALDQLAHRDAGECPDAELIAAYHEKSLESDEIARWEGHVADCGRCRKILAVLSAGVETPLADNEVAHLGELVATARPVA